MISLLPRIHSLPPRAAGAQKDTPTVYARVGKRLFDLFITGLFTALVLIWLVPLIALAISLTSPGPVLFSQLRTGRNGRPFRCLKFRTTVYHPRTKYHSAQQQHAQVTLLGQFLRTSRLEEIPHFLNVLLGDMSLVGPRPHTLQYDAQYWTVPGYRERQTVRPGITGLVQTRLDTDVTPGLIQMPYVFRYDRWYARQHSLWLDFKICWWAITGRVKALH
jgi:putative colanic acid biosynthesis UDP-glucose lipid carrier transferase